ncbi:MAG: leucyl aminopeptidase [Verrucomicrobiae bacterium]|nr:leucyl aminopeptidase [Verrucomicrobiae bacterium]
MQIKVDETLEGSSVRVFLRFKGQTVAQLSSREFSGTFLSSVVLRPDAVRREIYVGLGEEVKLTPVKVRQAIGVATKIAQELGVESLSIDARGLEAHVQGMVEGAMLANYRFERFKKTPQSENGKEPTPSSLRKMRVVVRKEYLKRAQTEVNRGRVLAEAVNYARELCNLPGNVINPITFAQEAEKLVKDFPSLKIEVWDEKRLKKEGWGGVLAVGGGSSVPPRMVKVSYIGYGRGQQPVVVIGKGVTFDSGGISIKPGDRMDEMKFDKSGACAVLGIMRAVAALQLKLSVIGIAVLAENMPGPTAYRPGDIITTCDGQTIEVLNTDAEGRIMLADALAYARLRLKPKLMIDLATLTGACIIALGPKRAGLFTENDLLRDQLSLIGEETGDRVWPLPVGEEFDEMMKSDVATVKNIGGREGGACTGASFLKTWVGEVPWAHLDIAGPAWITKEEKFLHKGATGFGVRLIVEYLRRHHG